MNCLISNNGMHLFNLPVTELYLLLDVRSKDKYDVNHVSGSISFNNIENIEERLKEIYYDSLPELNKVCIIDDSESDTPSSNSLFNYIQENGLPYENKRKKPSFLLLLTSFESFASMYPFLLSNGVEPYDENSILIGQHHL